MFDPLNHNYYYPPTSENLTRANKDVNELRNTQDIEQLDRIDQHLTESLELHETRYICKPNPYLDIYARYVALRREELGRRIFYLMH